MRRVTIGGLILLSALAFAACGGGASAPPASQPASQPPASQPPASEPAGSGDTGAACAPSTDAATVETTIEGNAFAQPLTAAAGDVVSWTNNDSVPHTVTMDDGACEIELGGGASAALQFSAAGSYAFHCEVHPSMTATIEVTE
jgi:plastocyanin